MDKISIYSSFQVQLLAVKVYTVEPLICSLRFHSHFDNVMMQFIINKRTDTKKTDVNLFRLVRFEIR